jgi:hypothetical protein
MIRGGSAKIRYADEQGHYWADQGIQVPYSDSCRDISRLTRRLLAPSAQARPAELPKNQEGKIDPPSV